MNSRGPLPQPDSRRGIAENGGTAPEPIQDVVNPPSWLTKPEREYFAEVIDLQRAAGVGIRTVDAEQYGRYVRMCFMQRKEKDHREYLAIGRGIDQLCGVLCIGEYPRQRVGIRGKKAAVKGKLALMLSKKNGTSGE